VSDAAADIIGAHMATVAMTSDHNWAKVIQAVSLSDKYEAWRAYDDRPSGAGIYSEVCRTNRPMRLTYAELVAHPLFRRFGGAADRHPPLRGWLCVPLIGRDGRNLGALHLSDKFVGDFTADDEAMALQLATIAAAAMENCAAYQEVRDADHRKDEFLAVLAHELRNPLAPILVAAGVLRMAETHDPHVKRVSDVLERQGKQLTRLIDDLLDATRIGRGKITLVKETVELAVVVERVMDAVRPAIDDRHLELTVSLPPEPLTLDVDIARMTQILSNLLLNAVKYTEPGGRISVTAVGERNDVVVSVRDTGIGMTEEFVARAFDMFTQAEHGQTYARGGLGIGLSLVRSLVEMHGGTVAARSDGVQKGSEFIVRLPKIAKDSR
jgi:signal transduction histidine kinase